MNYLVIATYLVFGKVRATLKIFQNKFEMISLLDLHPTLKIRNWLNESQLSIQLACILGVVIILTIRGMQQCSTLAP